MLIIWVGRTTWITVNFASLIIFFRREERGSSKQGTYWLLFLLHYYWLLLRILLNYAVCKADEELLILWGLFLLWFSLPPSHASFLIIIAFPLCLLILFLSRLNPFLVYTLIYYNRNWKIILHLWICIGSHVSRRVNKWQLVWLR